MSYWQSLWLFSVMLVGIIALPGMDMALIVAHTLRGGMQTGLATLAGVILGGVGHSLIGFAGVATLFAAAPKLFVFMLLASATYMAWIGLGLLRGHVSEGAIEVRSNEFSARRLSPGRRQLPTQPKSLSLCLDRLPSIHAAGIWAPVGAGSRFRRSHRGDAVRDLWFAGLRRRQGSPTAHVDIGGSRREPWAWRPFHRARTMDQLACPRLSAGPRPSPRRAYPACARGGGRSGDVRKQRGWLPCRDGHRWRTAASRLALVSGPLVVLAYFSRRGLERRVLETHPRRPTPPNERALIGRDQARLPAAGVYGARDLLAVGLCMSVGYAGAFLSVGLRLRGAGFARAVRLSRSDSVIGLRPGNSATRRSLPPIASM